MNFVCVCDVLITKFPKWLLDQSYLCKNTAVVESFNWNLGLVLSIAIQKLSNYGQVIESL